MAGAVEVLQVGISDLGVLPRDKSLKAIEQYCDSKKKDSPLISLDENNEYNINDTLIASFSDGTLYDNDVKIIEWYFDTDSRLIIQSNTDKQVNLYADLKVKECFIKANGPLFIKGRLDCKSTIAIEAEALWLADSVKCDGSILLAVRQGVGLLAPIHAQHLVINAAYVHQEAGLELSGLLDISTQCFKQNVTSKIAANSLRLIASQCQIMGDLTVNKDCFLIAGILIFGQEDAQSIIRLSGQNHLHAINLHVQGDTQVRIDHTDHSKEGLFIIDQNFLADENSVTHIFNTKLSANEIDNDGELAFNQSTLEVKTVNQHGIFDTKGSLITVEQEFIHFKKAVTELNNTVFSSPTVNVCGGEFSLDDCNYQGESCNVYAGCFDLKNQSVVKIDKLLFLKAANLSVKDCELNVSQSIQASGNLYFENTEVKTDYLITIKNKTIIKHSKITFEVQMELKGEIELTDSHLSGNIMTLKGGLIINDVRFRAKNLEIISEHAVINSLYSLSEKLRLQGSKEADQVIFNKSALTTKQFSCLDHATLNCSTFYGISRQKLSHNLHAFFKIIGSKFITEDQVRQYAGGIIEIDRHSVFRVGLLHSQGAMNAKDSAIECSILWKENSELTLESSRVEIKNKLSMQASKMKLKDHSIILTPVAQLSKGSELHLKETSALIATSELITFESTIASNASSIFTRKFMALGRTELCGSLLSAEELHIYETFEANSMSKVTVDGLISVANKAHARFSDSMVGAKDIQSFGEVLVSNSVVAAKDKVSVWSPATLILEGNSTIIAEDMVVRGTLVTQNKTLADTHEETEEQTKKAASQLKIHGELHITKCATVKGKADLSIEADDYLHSGSINLEASLRATGGLLSNHGDFKADSIYLGFDDQILNFGSFSAENMTVHSNFLNLAGEVYVNKSLSMAGFYNVNLGLIAANNYSNTSLLSFNGGLVLPNFSADPEYIFSMSNFTSVAKIAATTFLPGYSNLINLGFMIPGVVNSASSLYDACQNFSLDRYRNMRRHELMAEVCRFKGIASAAWGAFNSTHASFGEISNFGQNFTKTSGGIFNSDTYSFRNLKKAASNVDWKHFGTKTAGVFLGNYSDESLINVNFGAVFAHATAKKSLFSMNMGAEASLLSHTVNSKVFYNSGWSGGGDASFITDYTYNSGSLKGYDEFTFKSDYTINTGTLEGNHVHVTINHLSQEGELSLSNGQAKINEFSDTKQAKTRFSEMQVTGTNFELVGTLDAKNTRFNYTNKFKTDKDSVLNTSQVVIEAHEFSHGGELNYQGMLLVEADKATLEKGSIVAGKRTAEEELYVPKPASEQAQSASEEEKPSSEETTPASEENNTESPKEAAKEKIETEFKPQHIFQLHVSERVVLDGKMRGGDYTQIHGRTIDPKEGDSLSSDEDKEKEPPQIEQLIIGEEADIQLVNGSIISKKAEIAGHASLKSFAIDVGQTKLLQSGKLELEKSSFKGDVLTSDGVLNLDKSDVKLAQMTLSQLSKETFKDSIITTNQFIDDSQLSYQGEVGIFTDHYEHGGRVTHISPPQEALDNNLFYVKSKTADLHGSGDLDHATYSIEHFSDRALFISGTGQYDKYTIANSLALETEDYMNLNTPFYRDCDLTIKASGITMAGDYNNKARTLSLTSTVGDIVLLSNITSKNLYVKSAGNIRNNHNIFSEEIANFQAAGGFYNLGGVVNANTVAIKASEIKNISAGSNMASSPWGAAMGGAGIINGRKDAFLEATAGNIENYGGVIRSGEYTQLLATGNVLNACNVRSYKGAYDLIHEYDGGLIAGGNGTGTDGIGLYIKAGGKVISDASDFVSNGINYIEGDQGIELLARQDTHISKIKEKKTWYGKKTREVTTTTTIKNSVVHSATGQNILVTEHGGLKSVATRFSSPGGTTINARDNVELYSLKSQGKHYKSTSQLWGLSKHSTLNRNQESTPTLFIDNGVTRIYSTEGSIDARGAYFVGAGDLDLKAHGRIKFGVDILDHETIEKNRSYGISVPGMGAWQAWKSGGLMDAVTAEDATMAKLNSLLASTNTAELLASSANLGVNLYNTSNSIMRGLANETFSKELLSRYGLGGANGFSPTINLSMTESKTTTKYQTQGAGGVNRGGNVSLEAGEGIDLENGVRVHAGGNMTVNAPEIIATAAKLHSSVDQKTATQSIGISVTGQLQDASLGYSHSSTQATSYVNAELSAGGNMTLGYQGGAMHHVVLDGARIEAGSLDAQIQKLDIIDKQDTTVSKNESGSVSLSGQVSAYKGEGGSAITKEHSGIHVVDGINTGGHEVHIGEASMQGGEITTQGENHIQIDKLVTKQVVDHQVYNGVGISFNVNDLQRLVGQTATNQTGEQAIAIAEATFDRVNYQVENTSVIYGAQGTEAEISELVGQLHTESADGSRVIKNDKLHLTLDIPITNSDYIEKSRENIKAGLEKIADAFGMPETQNPSRDESTLPSRRDDEEEEEEEEIDNSPEDNPEEGKKSAADKEKAADAISLEEGQALVEKAFSVLSTKAQEEIKTELRQMKDEIKKGQINPKTRHNLEQHIKSALLQGFKAGSEETWSKFSKQFGSDSTKQLRKILSSPDALSKLSIKTYLGTKGLMINFAFNLGLKSIDNEKELMKGAITSTVGDIGFNILLSYSAGSIAGPISWTFVGLGILDTLVYDQEMVDKLFKDSTSLIQKAQQSIKEGEYLQAIGEQLIAADQMELAGQMQAMHDFSTLSSYPGQAVSFLWDKVFEKPKALETSKIPSIATNGNSFFNSLSTTQKKKQVVDNEHHEQPTR